MGVDRCQAKISLFLLFPLLVGHLVTHVIRKDAHRLLTHLAVLKLGVTSADLTHLSPDFILLFLLDTIYNRLLFLPFLLLLFCNRHPIDRLFSLFSVLLKLFDLFVNFELLDKFGAEGVSLRLDIGSQGDGLEGVTLALDDQTRQFGERCLVPRHLVHSRLMHRADLL